MSEQEKCPGAHLGPFSNANRDGMVHTTCVECGEKWSEPKTFTSAEIETAIRQAEAGEGESAAWIDVRTFRRALGLADV